MSALDPALLDRSLLPPNATDGERAIEDAMRSGIDLSQVGSLWNPATCPVAILPYLAWGLAISHWDPDWSEAQKRAEIADAIPYHRRKGTRAAVREVLDRFEPLLRIVEWWEMSPRGTPHTFEVRAPSSEIPASFLTSDTAAAIIRDVAAAKPARSHFTFIQSMEAQAQSWFLGGAMMATWSRTRVAAAHDDSPIWARLLQTEDGEPMSDDGGDFLEQDS
jgi:phage tail P2-like protein